MWTDAAIETLRQMALEGKSASTIAAALGAPSRNAVERRTHLALFPAYGAPGAVSRVGRT
jgi:hypothetical protein